MESYRLNSRLVEHGREFVIQTNNEPNIGQVASSVFVDGDLTEVNHFPHPTDIKPEDVLSLVKMRHGEKKAEVEKLLESYRRALKEPDATNLYQMGTAFFYKGYFSHARELFETAIKCDPDHHQAFNYLGRTCLAMGNFREAVAHCTTAARKRPAFADYRNGLGEAMLAAGNVPGAVREFEEALAINMYYADAYFNLGLALIRNALSLKSEDEVAGIRSRVADCLRKASLVNTDYKQPEFSDATAALGSADLKQALGLLETVREDRRERQRQEFAPFYMKYVMSPAFISERAIEERIQYLHRQISKNPSYVDLYAELSHCYLEQAKLGWQNAIKYLRQTLEINPSLTRVQAKLQQAEAQYESLCAALSRMEEKS